MKEKKDISAVVFSSEKTSENYLHINNCGVGNTNGRDSRCHRPVGRVDYQLIYVLEGTCTVSVADTEIIAEKGSVILYRPNEPQKYCFCGKDNSCYCYIHFTGSGCDTVFSRLNLDGDNVYRLRHHTEVKNMFLRICEEFYKRTKNYEMLCEGMLLSMISLIDTYNEKNSSPVPNRKSSEKINKIITEIQNSPQNELDIDECARRCNLSPSRFMTVFKNYTGRSPHLFLTEARVRRAMDLLLYSDFTVAEIAELCGYADQNYFSRIFKKYASMSPSEYRKK